MGSRLQAGGVGDHAASDRVESRQEGSGYVSKDLLGRHRNTSSSRLVCSRVWREDGRRGVGVDE
jgi:ribosomal protein L35AE/L33A